MSVGGAWRARLQGGPAKWVGSLGASVSEVGAMRLAGTKRGKGVPRRSGGVSGAERGRPVAARVRACGLLPYLRVGNVFGRAERLIT